MAAIIVVAAVHAAGDRHLGHGGARCPLGEADLRVEVLLRGGVLDGGHDRDNRVLVLLREGLRAARGGLLPRAPSLQRAGSNTS